VVHNDKLLTATVGYSFLINNEFILVADRYSGNLIKVFLYGSHGQAYSI